MLARGDMSLARSGGDRTFKLGAHREVREGVLPDACNAGR